MSAAHGHSHALTLLALLLFAASAWQANRDVCPGCRVADIQLAEPDGTPIRARLYVPPLLAGFRDGSSNPQSEIGNPRSLAAVVVCHGYLANLAFMELPWAADLTRLGFAALVLDRRGHGRSGGELWPRPVISGKLDDREPDVAAAVAYLRAQPLVDPARIALLGHSDGATAAIIAASADWEVRATVAVSASVAPWEYVNHIAPQNLLLVYGADDRFVLDNTDSALIKHATRDILAGPGELGDPAEGSGRRLLRVPSRGHLNVFYSSEVQREVLRWLRDSLGGDSTIVASGHRWQWIWVGLAALLLLVSSPHRATEGDLLAGPTRPANLATHHAGSAFPRSAAVRAAMLARSTMSAAALIAAWTLGLLLAPWLSRNGQGLVPGQEGGVFAGLVLGPGLPLVLVAVLRQLHRRLRWPIAADRQVSRSSIRRRVASDVATGMLTAVLVFGAAHLLFLHHYESQLNLTRGLLLVIFTALALPTFAALEGWLGRLDAGGAWLPPVTVAALAVVTAILSGALFERMSRGPGYLLALVLALCEAHRLGAKVPCLSTPVFGALTFGWLGAVVCALY
jgi:predicted esterase